MTIIWSLRWSQEILMLLIKSKLLKYFTNIPFFILYYNILSIIIYENIVKDD